MSRSLGTTKIAGVDLGQSNVWTVTMEAELDKREKKNETLKGLFTRPAIYSTFAVAVYFIGRSFWWIGLILFVLLTFYMLVEFFVNGSVLVVIAMLFRLVYKRATYYRNFNSERFSEMQKPFGSVVRATGVLILIQLYYLLMVFFLGVYFFETA